MVPGQDLVSKTLQKRTWFRRLNTFVWGISSLLWVAGPGGPQMMSQLSGNTGDCGQVSYLKTVLSPPIDLLGFSNSTCLGATGNLRGFLMMVFIVTVV